MTNWCGSAGQPGEANATTYSYRNNTNGTTQNITCYFHGYQIALNPAKTAQSLTLPSTGNFRIMAMDLITPAPATTTTALVSSLNPSPAGTSVTFTATVTGSSPDRNRAICHRRKQCRNAGRSEPAAGDLHNLRAGIRQPQHYGFLQRRQRQCRQRVQRPDTDRSGSAHRQQPERDNPDESASRCHAHRLRHQHASVGTDLQPSPLQPTHGTLSGTAPNLTYTPAAGYVGADSFTFTDNNGSLTSSPATVSVTVNPLPATTTALASALIRPCRARASRSQPQSPAAAPLEPCSLPWTEAMPVRRLHSAAHRRHMQPPRLTAGSHAITASYSGDIANAASTSATLTQTVLIPTTLAVSNASGMTGQTLHLTGRLRRNDTPKATWQVKQSFPSRRLDGAFHSGKTSKPTATGSRWTTIWLRAV